MGLVFFCLTSLYLRSMRLTTLWKVVEGVEASCETWFYEHFMVLFYESFTIHTKIFKCKYQKYQILIFGFLNLPMLFCVN